VSAGERAMLDRLHVRYGKVNGNGFRYLRAEHVKNGIGWEANRILDLWGSFGAERGAKLHGHEIKVSRSDWLVELKDPTKAEAFTPYCDYFWLVVSDKSIVRPGELPEGWGLMVAYGHTVRVVTAAKLREQVEPMPRSLQGTFGRAVTKTAVRLASLEPADPVVDRIRADLRLPPHHHPEYTP
jgi:hypothetical protein